MDAYSKNSLKEVMEIYFSIKEEIKRKLAEFKVKKDQNKIFAELVFCILTPQSNAKSCWRAVENLISKNLLLNGNKSQIVKELNGVRFKYKKAEYIIKAREKFSINGELFIISKINQFKDVYKIRDWLVENIKGLSYKEASHFLRNIGLGENFAILDRHILKNLKLLGIINEIPRSLSKKRYYEIEEKMKKFSEKINIPLEELDFVLWYKEKGEIFK